MELCLSVILLPLLNPVQLAEEDCQPRHHVGGRVVFGIGLGYREQEFEAFGVRVAEPGAADARVAGVDEAAVDRGQCDP